MASHKSRRQNNHHYSNNHTDYESDTVYVSDMQNQLPPLRSNEELNLLVLQRHNPSIASILSLAPYSVVYIFSPATRGWEKMKVEGTMFVCQLTPGSLGEDRYSVFVLNRSGLQNFELPLTESENVELTETYVILKADEATEGGRGTNGIAGGQNGNSTDVRIYGIWIYQEPPPNSTADARTINADLIRQCAAHAGQSLKMARQRLEETRQNGMHVAAAAAEMQTPPVEEAQASTPMGRQMSLKDLFGQQRAEDDGWSVRAHHVSPEQQQQQFYQNMNPLVHPQHNQQPPAQPQGQADVLGDLFRRAGIAYQGGQGY
ncbi:Dcp1-like decapping [Penicillium sp. IBT 18751x]|nr:Dcp1-like decapping [Penicillium sp. IBT 18751x]